MNRTLMMAGICLLLTASGCKTDDLARQLVQPDTYLGKSDLMWWPSGDDLVKKGRVNRAYTMEMPDKTPLDVWVINARTPQNGPAASKGTMVILHGLYQSKVSWPYVGAGERLSRKGYDVVLMDLRRHGRSKGEFITYGVKEKEDLKTVIDRLIADKVVNSNIYVFGVNYGAATAVQYAAIDPRCKGVIAAAAYESFPKISPYILGHVLLADPAELARVIVRAGEMADFKPEDASAVAAVKKVRCPILLLHGILDLSVPLEHSQAILEAANEPKKLMDLRVEQIAMMAIMEDWVADEMDKLAQKGLSAIVAPATAPAK